MQREVVCGNGLRTTYGYDSRNQLISLRAGFEGKAPLLQAVYRYDGNGNRVVKEEKSQRNLGIQQKTECIAYSYDKMNRLTRESRNGNETSYSYDFAGNRTSRIQAGNKEIYRYNSRNQLTELTCDNNNITYSYDFAGNLVEENHCSATAGSSKIKYIYDFYNRNTEVKGKSFRQKNIYDAEGYRSRLEEYEKITDFVYRAGMLLGEKGEESEPKKTYVLGNEYIGLASETEKESTVRYYVTDEQGSVRYVLDGNGEVESYYQYDAFGETVTQEGNQSRLQYNSQIRDELSGLYYLRARYYNPRTGRFTQEDVIYNDGLNLYAYCNSNPVIYSDPSGFASKGGSSSKKPIQPYEVTTYDDFTKRSVKGDGLEGHEIWQHANLNENGYATTRLSTEASKNNIVMALPHDVHVEVNKAQNALDARGQSPIDNIDSNAEILYNNSKVPDSAVDEAADRAKKHYCETKKG